MGTTAQSRSTGTCGSRYIHPRLISPKRQLHSASHFSRRCTRQHRSAWGSLKAKLPTDGFRQSTQWCEFSRCEQVTYVETSQEARTKERRSWSRSAPMSVYEIGLVPLTGRNDGSLLPRGMLLDFVSHFTSPRRGCHRRYHIRTEIVDELTGLRSIWSHKVRHS